MHAEQLPLRTEGLLRQVQIMSPRVAPELEQRIVVVLGCHLILLAAPEVEVVDGDAGAGVAVRVEQMLQARHQRRLATPLRRRNANLMKVVGHMVAQCSTPCNQYRAALMQQCGASKKDTHHQGRRLAGARMLLPVRLKLAEDPEVGREVVLEDPGAGRVASAGE
jgi:hypothetical protein